MYPHRDRGFTAASRGLCRDIRARALGWLVLLVLTAALGGCASLAPKYTQPQPPVPAEWPQGAAYEASTPGASAVSEIGWRDFYRDGRLRTVVELSLTNNRDLRIATLNIERARAIYRIRRADQFPTIEVVGNGLPSTLGALGFRV